MNLSAKIAQSESLLRASLPRYRAPGFMCSFGKDSMVLLWILRRMGVDLPVVF
jgi:3'-phosphoadenosine 5'-phosphosulfate sulfotransferase (PAPS reductase)/FAD synthetase